MTTIVTRSGKGSPLTHVEVDANFTNLNSDKLDVAGIAAGSAASPTLKFTSDGNTGLYSPGADQVALATDGVGRLFVDSLGRVSIGTSTPSNTLHVAGTGSTQAVFERTGSNGVFIGLKDGSGSIAYLGSTNGVFSIQTPGSSYSDKLVVTSAGNVGIGTTPGYILDVANGNVSGAKLFKFTGATAGGSLFGYSDAGGVGITRTDPYNSMVYFDTGNTIQFYTGSTERGRWDSSGRFLVGTSSVSGTAGAAPYARIQIEGNLFGSTGPGSIALRMGTAPTSIVAGNEIGQIAFAANNNGEFARIDCVADGTAGTNDYPGRLVFSVTASGASSPTERLRIRSDGAASFGQGATAPGSGVAGTLINAGDGGILITNNTNPFLRCYTLNGGFPDALQIAANGNVTNANNSYGAISDIKLKENIVDANSQWDDLKALRVRNYNLKEGRTHTQIGLVAQEVELVSPGLVNESPDHDAEGNDLGTVTKSVNYSVLYMKAVKALQEAMERIETLEAKVAALEGA